MRRQQGGSGRGRGAQHARPWWETDKSQISPPPEEQFVWFIKANSFHTEIPVLSIYWNPSVSSIPDLCLDHSAATGSCSAYRATHSLTVASYAFRCSLYSCATAPSIASSRLGFWIVRLTSVRTAQDKTQRSVRIDTRLYCLDTTSVTILLAHRSNEGKNGRLGACVPFRTVCAGLQRLSMPDAKFCATSPTATIPPPPPPPPSIFV